MPFEVRQHPSRWGIKTMNSVKRNSKGTGVDGRPIDAN